MYEAVMAVVGLLLVLMFMSLFIAIAGLIVEPLLTRAIEWLDQRFPPG